MKKVSMALVVLLAVVLVTRGYAVTNSNPPIPAPSDVEFKFSDVGSFYIPQLPEDEGVPGVPSPNPPNPGPVGVFMPQPAGAELRNVFKIDTMHAPPGSDAFWTSSSAQQITGLIWGLITPTPIPQPQYGPQTNLIHLVDSGRNGATLPPTWDTLGVTGGRVQFYIDGDGPGGVPGLASPYDAFVTNDPFDWIENPADGSLGPDQFPTVNTNGEELWLDLVFIPVPDAFPTVVPGGPFPFQGEVPDGTLLRETVAVGSQDQGNGVAWLMIVGGSGQGLFQKGGKNAEYIAEGGWDGTGMLPPGVTADMFISFNVGPNQTSIGAPPWGNWSKDPALVKSIPFIPEPVTLLGLVLGGTGLTTYIRRRRVA